MKSRQPRRPIIAISLVEHFGDIVAAEPVARFVRRQSPDAYLVWVVKRSYRELVQHHPQIDAVLPIGCLTEWSSLRDSGTFDRIVDLQIHGRECAICRLKITRPQSQERVNIGNYYAFGNLLQAFCYSAGLPLLDETPRLHISPQARHAVDRLRLPQQFIVLHCTSNQPSRDWTPEKWNELARRLVEYSDEVAIVEVGVKPVIDFRHPRVINMCGQLSLLETAEVIRRALLFIGIDSGPAHLANASQTPGVILLGRYDAYERYMPYSGAYARGTNARIIRHDRPAREIPVADVLSAARGLLAERQTRVPTVSVIIPTYNHARFITDAINSALSQMMKDLEIIVINDGSTDETASILRPYVEKGQIRYVEQPNRGQAAARNRGLSAANGEFIAFLDDDDRWPPDKLDWQVQLLRKDPEAVLAYGDYAQLRSDGTLSPPIETKCPAGDAHGQFKRGCWILSPGQALIRASALRACGGLDPTIWGSDDWDLYLRLSRLGPFLHRRQVALHYRVHESNASRDVVRHVRNHLKVVRKHLGYNFPLIVAQQRESSRYFLPSLMRFGHMARRKGQTREAMQAYLYALSFRPGLLVRRAFWVPFVGALVGQPPRQ